jgi:hypothetical protein
LGNETFIVDTGPRLLSVGNLCHQAGAWWIHHFAGEPTVTLREILGLCDRYGHLFPSLEAALTVKLDETYRAAAERSV